MADVLDELGGPAVVARMTGVKPPSVIEWRKRGIPAERCAVIEVKTDGQWPCERLNSALPWLRVRDPNWPWSRRGRPVIDVTRSTSFDATPAATAVQEPHDAA
jgi:DNA-binding transcriptional regulator YdaS (Cro superfamily)